MRKITNHHQTEETFQSVTILPPSLDEKMKLINPYVQESKDIKVREFAISGKTRARAIIIFIEGLAEPQALNTDVLQPLMIGRREDEAHGITLHYYIDRIQSTFITAGEIIGSFNRLFRFVAFFIAVSLPSIYISLISFQPELLPFDMVLSVAQQRSEVAFPAVVEALIMEVVIQLVVEAGLRLPMPVSSLGRSFEVAQDKELDSYGYC